MFPSALNDASFKLVNSDFPPGAEKPVYVYIYHMFMYNYHTCKDINYIENLDSDLPPLAEKLIYVYIYIIMIIICIQYIEVVLLHV